LVIGLGLGRPFCRFDSTTGSTVEVVASNAVGFCGTVCRLTVLTSVVGLLSSPAVESWRLGCLVICLGLEQAFWHRFDLVDFSLERWSHLEVDCFLVIILGVAPSEFRSMASSKAKFLVGFRGPLCRLTAPSSVVGSVE